MFNQFNVHRVAHGRFTIPNVSASTYINTDCVVPAGAIITGIKIVAHTAVTTANVSSTVVPRVGTAALAATVVVSNLPAVTVVATTALALSYITAAGSFNLAVGVTGSSSNTATAKYDYYVDYLYVDP